MNSNLYQALADGFPADRDAVAIETADAPPLYYTWSDIERASAMFANLLGSLELPAGARIAVQTEKSVEALLFYLGVLRAGFVYLPLNTAYQSAEIDYFIGDAQPSVVVCSSRHFSWVSRIAFTAGTQHVFTLDDNRTGSLLERAARHSDRHAVALKRDDDLAAILYTSGTTGRSKGAMLSHGNMRSNALTLRDYWDWQPDDVLIHVLPIFHVHGLFVAAHGALVNGSKLLWWSRFDAKQVIARMAEATVFMGVPTLYVRLLADPALTREACRPMRLFVSGSAPLLIETFDAFRERTGHTILERYGMSETVMLTSNPCRPEAGERRGGTVGFPLPGVEERRDEPHVFLDMPERERVLLLQQIQVGSKVGGIGPEGTVVRNVTGLLGGGAIRGVVEVVNHEATNLWKDVLRNLVLVRLRRLLELAFLVAGRNRLAIVPVPAVLDMLGKKDQRVLHWHQLEAVCV